MKIQPIIDFNGMERSQAVEDNIRSKIDDLEKRFANLVSCRTSVNYTSHRGNQGHLYEIHIELTLPGKDIWVSKASGQNHAHEDVYVAVRDTFAAALRMLDNRIDQMHEHRPAQVNPMLGGLINRLFDEQGYGFIVSDNGQDVYFNKNALVKPVWHDLIVEQRVEFRQYQGDKGLYAMQVAVRSE